MVNVPTLSAKLLAECIGTFILCFTVLNCIASKSSLAALSIGSSLMIAIYCTGSVSGGHLNPAVTLGLFVTGQMGGPGGKIPVREAIYYVISQMMGAAIAAVLSGFMWTTKLGGFLANDNTAGELRNASATLGSTMFEPWKVFEGEVIYTMLLVFVVLNVATTNSGNSYFGLAIGFTILAAVAAEGNVSGTCLNPAVTFAVLLTDVGHNLHNLGLYWGAQVFGSLSSCIFFYGCRAYMFNKDGKSEEETSSPSLSSKLLAEFLGTFYLVITVYLVVVQSVYAPILAVVGIASSLMCMIYALGDCSGGNFNPAVSFALMLTGKLSAPDFGMYVGVQLLGGLTAVGLGALMQSQAVVALVVDDSKVNDMGHGSLVAVVMAEMFYTFLLVFAVLNGAVRDAPNQYFALIIGFSIVVGGIAVGSLSGGAFNPSVSLSLFFAGLFQKQNQSVAAAVLYPLSEFAGSALAAGAFKMISKKTVYDKTMDDESSSDEAAW